MGRAEALLAGCRKRAVGEWRRGLVGAGGAEEVRGTARRLDALEEERGDAAGVLVEALALDVREHDGDEARVRHDDDRGPAADAATAVPGEAAAARVERDVP